MKRFNTTSVCIPSKHYMVDLSDRVAQIAKMVDAGDYFTINRARQYGKTTTITALRVYLSADYNVVSLDFQGIGDAGFRSEQSFVKAFCRLLIRKQNNYRLIPDDIRVQLEDYLSRKEDKAELDELFMTMSSWCEISEKPIVLIIDEIDSATNNRVFLDFLSQLRDGYIARDTDQYPTFQSVILTGVTDVKHLRSKIRDEDQHRENSPWNIAADFDIDMSLSRDGIKGMLDEYEEDHHLGIDTAFLAGQIRDYTNGYPFLVSRICQLLDEHVIHSMSLAEAWTKEGLDKAVNLLLSENNTLFQSLTKNLNNCPDLKSSIRSILMEGTTIAYNAQHDDIAMMHMYGLIMNYNNTVCVANRIFETMLYNLFLTEEELKRNSCDVVRHGSMRW